MSASILIPILNDVGLRRKSDVSASLCKFIRPRSHRAEMHFYLYCFNNACPNMHEKESITFRFGGVVVSVFASQAADPGSNPAVGDKNLTSTCLVDLVPGKCYEYY